MCYQSHATLIIYNTLIIVYLGIGIIGIVVPVQLDLEQLHEFNTAIHMCTVQ
jgi:hypothetical protein